MKLKFWGTRGSLPRPIDHNTLVNLILTLAQKASDNGITTLEEFQEFITKGKAIRPLTFGGHTSCTEVSHGETSCYVDMGTGITDAGQHSMSIKRTDFTIFQTHLHWDHIMGMPFFIPIYIPGSNITIYHVHANAPDFIRLQFNGVNFPVRWDQLAANIEFKQIRLYDKVSIGSMTVSPFALDHPGGSFGYRFEANDQSAAIGVDGEYKRFTPKELGHDLAYYQNLDLLVFDAQYEMDELSSRFDWGHCSPPIGVDLALREGIRNLVLTHHDPRSNEEKGLRMKRDAEKYKASQLANHVDMWLKREQKNGPNIISAYDGLTIDLDDI